MTDFYRKTIRETIEELKTSENGLSESEAQARLQRYGYNAIEETQRISPFRIFISQFASPLIWVLIAATAISLALGEKTDAIVIGVILVLNAIIGFVQEYKAEKAIEALKRMASLKTIVIRDGKEKEIDSSELVPGDLIILKTGEKIPADARLIEIYNLQTQEAALTGESLPVDKMTGIISSDKAVLGEMRNIVFAGTIITNGRGKAVITDTGMRTQLGKIAHMIQTTKAEMTPLQKQLKNLGRWLGIITLAICAFVFAAGVVKGEPILKFFLVAVSLAVAAIPEGLPAVVTISLAIGIKKMVRRNALIRKLPSVETLGSTTVICTDKTGTLTHNEMTVRKIFVDEEVINVSGSGYEPNGSFSGHTKTLPFLLNIGALNNDSELELKEGRYCIIGNPTEGALIVSAAKAGLDKNMLENKNRRIDEIQFSSERKMMTTVHDFKGNHYSYAKGAPDILLKHCRHIEVNGKTRLLTKHDRIKILKMNEHFAEQALRVIGFAYKKLKKSEKKDDYEKDLVFVGMQGMIDPPRDEVKDAVAKCERAGIKVVMITGDFKGTAVAIAKELGIPGKAVSGDELEHMDLDRDVLDIGVYARVNPEHKIRIIEALKKKGHIVAMTGDGVNDAPALKRADIGIAMGVTGTDVTKEVSDMILLDDNFTSIVNAVEEGRGVYDNIRKFFALLISCNIGEVMIIFLSILFGLPLPLTVIQILLINLVTDGLPAVALGADPFEPYAMERKPRRKDEPIYKGLNHFIIYSPIIMTAIVLALFYYMYTTTSNLAKAQTVSFLAIAYFEMFIAFASRSTRYSSFRAGIFKNRYLVGAVLLSVIVSLAVVYIPMLQPYFATFPISVKELLGVILLSSIGFIYLEIHKTISSRKEFAVKG